MLSPQHSSSGNVYNIIMSVLPHSAHEPQGLLGLNFEKTRFLLAPAPHCLVAMLFYLKFIIQVFTVHPVYS